MLAPRKKLWSTPDVGIDAAIKLLNITEDDIVYDVGCGDGNFVLRCAEVTEAKCIGIEIDEERAAFAKKRINDAGFGDRVSILIGNALDFTLDDATIIFLYLIPRGLKLILPILHNISQNFRVVTYMAGFVDIEPIKIEKISPSHQGGAEWPLYLYEFNQKKSIDDLKDRKVNTINDTNKELIDQGS